jgi:hypothetical protein
MKYVFTLIIEPVVWEGKLLKTILDKLYAEGVDL